MFQNRKKGDNDQKLERTKENILKELSQVIKDLQKLALSCGTLDVSRNDDYAINLTYVIEAIFLHGYQVSSRTNFFKKTSSGTLPTPDFWELVHSFTHNDVIHQLAHLSHITSHIGLCRAWLRLALNDGLLESYFHAILADKKKVHHSFTSKSLLRDDEAVAILLTHLSGLIELTFDFNYNTPSLNQWTGQSLQLSGVWEPPYAPAATIAAKVTEKSGQVLTVPKAAILSNVSSTNDLAEDKIVQQETKAKDENTTPEYSNDQDIEIVTKVTSTSKKKETPSEEDSNLSQENKNSGLSSTQPLSEVPKALIYPRKISGGNMLGMASGWSSSFEPCDTSSVDVNCPEDVEEVASKASPKPEVSFHGMLTDYANVVRKKFTSNGYGLVPSSSEKSIDIEESCGSTESFQYEKSSGFEIIDDPTSPEDVQQERRLKLLSLINNIAREKGLDGQNYKCHGCSRPIGMIYGQYKVCCFDGSYYCYECHVDDEHIIPSKIVHNWDLSKYKVAKHVKLFLMQIDEEPLFHIDEVNSTLYNAIGKMKKAKHLRMQLQHMKGYVMTCKNSMIFEDVRRRMWPRDYLWDDIHQYSLLDLIQVNSGQLHHHIRKIISFCKKHVYECEVCSQKGFICEICKDSKILYPFEVHNTLQCSRCKAVFHKHCKLERSCPRCIRRRSRSERMSEDMNIDKEKINDALNPLL